MGPGHRKRDRATHEGVYAITQWYADLNEIVRSEVVCLRVDVAKTDAAGRFEVSSSSGIVSPTLFNQRRFVILYKTRYKQLGPSESNELPLTMERDAREGIPRMKYLTQYILGVSCRDDEHDKRTLLPLYRAAYSEMETLAPEPTKEELALLTKPSSGLKAWKFRIFRRCAIGLNAGRPQESNESNTQATCGSCDRASFGAWSLLRVGNARENLAQRTCDDPGGFGIHC